MYDRVEVIENKKMIGGMKCEKRNHGVGYIHCSGATGCYCSNKVYWRIYTVSGSSMHPTFQDRNKVIKVKFLNL